LNEPYNSANYIGAALVVLIFVSLFFIAYSIPFPSSTFDGGQSIPTSPSDQIGPAMSGFLWDFRGFDLLMVTIVLFSVSICCLAMLREEP
jgi:multisubunit Na+/H+ antiporter MnhB subunit